MFDYQIFKLEKPVLLQVYTTGLLPTQWKENLFFGGWFKIFLPKSLGGFELPLSEGLKVLYQTAAVHGSLGWRVNLGAGAGYFAGNMPEETSSQIFSPRHAVISGSGSATGSASRKGHHWEVNGRWNFCTGADIASAYTVNAITDSGAIRTFLLLPEQVQVQKSWPFEALKATATYTIIARRAIVQPEYSFQVGDLTHYQHYATYQLDFYTFARFCMAASLAGLAQCFSSHMKDYLIQKNYSDQNLETFDHVLSEFQSRLLEASISLSDTSTNFQSAQEAVREVTLHYKQILENLSFQLLQSCDMSIFRQDSLPYQAAKDFWLAGKHFLCR